jgi:type IV pilus assembly protein PilW
MHKPDNQRGMSLISLMVALAIGIFLLAGLFQVWYQTRLTFSSQGQLAQLEDNQRMALTMMANTVQTGGFYPVYLNYPASATPTYTPALFTAAGNMVSAQYLYGTHDSTTKADTLTVRFIADKTSADSTTLDCQGQSEPTGTLVTNTYKIDTTKNNVLACSTDGGNTYLPIIQGSLNSMVITYGVDTLGDGTALQYLTADNVQTLSVWGRVLSVKIALTFNNPLFGQPGNAGQNATLPTITRVIAITHS